MRACDVLVVGGGPAGSTCAWALRRAGADVLLVDRARFPRDKVCAGWLTPGVLEALQLTPAEYRAAGLVIQEFTAFRVGVIGGRSVEARYGHVVSYGVRRCEFDYFLVRRAQVPVLDGTPLTSLRREGQFWIANDNIRATTVVGAGGHFCPVARHINPPTRNGIVVAREGEIPLDDTDRCTVPAQVPALFFSRDLDGYGWVVRKGDYLNVGIGRRTSRDFDVHVREFTALLHASRLAPARAVDWRRWRGHAYLLRDFVRRTGTDGLLLVGDSAGLAYAESGEGIGPAVRSGLLAARMIVTAGGRIRADHVEAYTAQIAPPSRAAILAARLRLRVPAAVGRAVLRSPLLARHALDRWFLRTSEPQNNLLSWTREAH
jgi:flavin-dependent dehydrogenase